MEFRYAQIERALASMHSVPADKTKTFRARIRNYQKIGLVPSSPGKGQKIAYTTRDAVIWAICFELEEVGFSPDACRKIVETLHDVLIPFFLDQHDEHKDGMFLVLIGLFLEWRLSGDVAQGIAYASGIYTRERVNKWLDISQRLVIIRIDGVRDNLIRALAAEVAE